MTGLEPSRVKRRNFLQSGAIATTAALSKTSVGKAADSPASKTTLPHRLLGKTGVDLTFFEYRYPEEPRAR